MADQDTGYVQALAGELCTRHPALVASLEDDLALLRGRIAIVAAWIHNDAYDDTARRALAQALGLPQPTPMKTRQETTS